MSRSAQKDEGRDIWESAAPGWAKWEEKFSALLDDATDTLLDMAGVGERMRVIDLACGAGSQSVRAARRVGPTGQILAIDISRTMLQHLRENARRAGLKNIGTAETAAEDLDTALGRFDAGCALQVRTTQPSEMAAAVKPSEQPRTESCVASSNGRCEA